MLRRDNRGIVMQAIFLVNDEPDLTIEQVETKVAKNLDLKVIPAYAHEVVAGVLARKSKIEADISKCLRKGWCLEWVDQISVTIIEVAIFEISQSGAISAPAVVSGALILCEEFDDLKSKSFISGILVSFMPNK